jgi:Lar family restriction alleviation protein
MSGAGEVELKPCPFCGNPEPSLCAGNVCDEWVTCLQCGCDGPFRDSEAEAIAAWNTRHAEAAQLDAMRAAREALRGMLPGNLCLANNVLPDDALVPLDTTMGELRAVAAALASLTAAIEGEG